MKFVPPESLVDHTLKQNLLGLSFTYNEPAIWFEYTLDTFKLAKSDGSGKNMLGRILMEVREQIRKAGDNG